MESLSFHTLLYAHEPICQGVLYDGDEDKDLFKGQSRRHQVAIDRLESETFEICMYSRMSTVYESLGSVAAMVLEKLFECRINTNTRTYSC